MEFQPLGNESSPFCRTEWFHINVKMAFFHLRVWLIGQGGSKFQSRPGFDSWQFTAQAEKCLLGRKLQILQISYFLKKLEILIQGFNRTYLPASFHSFGILAKAM